MTPDYRTEAQIARDAENAILAQTELTDLAPHSSLSMVARGMLAPELAALQSARLWDAEGAYIQTAVGPALERKLADVGLQGRLAAREAFGPVHLERELEADGAPAGTDASPIVIPAGHAFNATTPEGETVRFTLDEEVTLPVGTLSALGVVTADVAGSSGNVGAGALVAEALNGLKRGTNPTAFTSGADLESDSAARARYYGWLRGRARGTAAALRYGATTYTDEDGRQPVLDAAAEEHLDPLADGRVATLYIIGHSGTLPSDALLAAVQQRIDGYEDDSGNSVEGWRLLSQPVVVEPAQLVYVDVSVDLTLAPGAPATVRQALLNLIAQNIAQLRIGQPLTSKLIFDAICTFGSQIENAVITSPAAEVTPGANQKIVANT